ncbi:MAG: hypothetical protein ABIJ74_00110 [archaeon]
MKKFFFFLLIFAFAGIASAASPTGYFINPSGRAVIYDTAYLLEWDAFDADGNPLTYTVDWDGTGGIPGGGNAGSNKYYAITSLLVPGRDYRFTLRINDGISPVVTVYSGVLSVKPKQNTLSIADFSITPNAIYGDNAIDVNLSLRNNSAIVVDINATFYNSGFPGGSIRLSSKNVQPNSKAKFSFRNTFSGLVTGDKNVRVFAQEFFAGTSTPTGNQLQAYANFTVLAPKQSVALPETNHFVVLIVVLAVVVILRKKNS